MAELFPEEIPDRTLRQYDELVFDDATLHYNRKHLSTPDKLIGHEAKYDMKFPVLKYIKKDSNHSNFIFGGFSFDRYVFIASVKNLKFINEKTPKAES